jgi:hypothetical protein
MKDQYWWALPKKILLMKARWPSFRLLNQTARRVVQRPQWLSAAFLRF